MIFGGATMYQETKLTEQIICCAYNVHNHLGSGFLEKVYENALWLELRDVGLSVEQQKPIDVAYKGHTVGEFIADLVVGDRVIVELKALDNLAAIHEVQLKNYLKATGIEVGLLINFGSSVEVKRKHFKST